MKSGEIEAAAKRAVIAIERRIGDPDMRPTVDHLLYYLPEASEIESRRFRDVLVPIITAEFSALAEDDMEAVLAKLREKWAGWTTRLSIGPQGYCYIAMVQDGLREPISDGATLAEALSAAMEGE